MLSVCMIARDAREDIRRALGSVWGIADEVVVVDTGSVDDTVAVASSLGARVERHTWHEDFAAARNAAHSLAIGDWILWLDTDEMLLPESRDVLQSSLARKELAGLYVLREDLMSESPLRYSEMLLLRLYRRLPRLRLVGRCHEHFQPPFEETASSAGMVVEASSIRIRHWGYLGDRQICKARRNARLMELELRDRPKQTYFMVELARTLATMGEQRAQGLFRETAEMALGDWQANRPRRPEYILVLEWLFQQGSKLPPTLSLSDADAAAKVWFPNSVPLLWCRAARYFALEQFEEARQVLEHLWDLSCRGTYDRTISFAPELLGDRIRLNLAGCYVRTARLDQARQLYDELLGSVSCGQQARQNLDAIRGLLAEQEGGTGRGARRTMRPV